MRLLNYSFIFFLSACATTPPAAFRDEVRTSAASDLDFQSRVRFDKYFNAFKQASLPGPKRQDDLAVSISFFQNNVPNSITTTLAQIALRSRDPRQAETERADSPDPVATDVRVTVRALNGMTLKSVFGYESLQPSQGGAIEIPVGDMKPSETRVFIAEIAGESMKPGMISPLQAHLDYVATKPEPRAKKSIVSASLNWHAPGVPTAKLNPGVVRNAILAADALTLLKVGALAAEEKFEAASGVLAAQILNLKVARQQADDTDLADEEKSLLETKLIVDRRAGPQAVPVREAGASARDLLLQNNTVLDQVPGSWSLIHSLLVAHLAGPP